MQIKHALQQRQRRSVRVRAPAKNRRRYKWRHIFRPPAAGRRPPGGPRPEISLPRCSVVYCVPEPRERGLFITADRHLLLWPLRHCTILEMFTFHTKAFRSICCLLLSRVRSFREWLCPPIAAQHKTAKQLPSDKMRNCALTFTRSRISSAMNMYSSVSSPPSKMSCNRIGQTSVKLTLA